MRRQKNRIVFVQHTNLLFSLIEPLLSRDKGVLFFLTLL
nr:MAG TPA_asm: hypothetical protein [Caudoviricetes sp.]